MQQAQARLHHDVALPNFVNTVTRVTFIKYNGFMRLHRPVPPGILCVAAPGRFPIAQSHQVVQRLRISGA
jgi:hypothetical protein